MSTPEDINLTADQMMIAATAGITRQIENLQLGRKPAHNLKPTNDWQIHVEGCMTEFALGEYLTKVLQIDAPWNGKGKLRAPDVGDFDCRSGPGQNYDLCLHRTDPDDRIIWLVCGINGRYTIKGYLWARMGKRKELWGDKYRTGRPAFWVPQHELYPPRTFKTLAAPIPAEWPDVMGTG